MHHSLVSQCEEQIESNTPRAPCISVNPQHTFLHDKPGIRADGEIQEEKEMDRYVCCVGVDEKDLL